MLSFNNGLRELKLLMTTQPSTPSPLAEPTPDHNSTSPTTLQQNSPSSTIVLRRRHFVLGVPNTRYCVEEFGINFSLKKRLPGVRNTCWSGYHN